MRTFPEIDHDFKNTEIMDEGVKKLRAMPGVYQALKFEAFNKAEADACRKYMESRYPDVKVYYSWLEFITPPARKEKGK